MTRLLDLKRYTCKVYDKMWSRCQSKKDLFDMGLDANGIEFIADSIAFGWGLDKSYILREFADFINGAYQRNKDGYTSEAYVGYFKDIVVKSTLVLVAYCENATIKIPKGHVCKIYICGGSNVAISNHGETELCVYGQNNVKIISQEGSKIKREDFLTEQVGNYRLMQKTAPRTKKTGNGNNT